MDRRGQDGRSGAFQRLCTSAATLTRYVLASQCRSQHNEHMSKYDRYNTLDDLDKGDELERYVREERVPRHVDPLRCWEVNNERYPVYHRLCLFLFGYRGGRQRGLAEGSYQEEDFH